MNGKLKMLGIAFAAMLLVSAVAAQAASADVFRSADPDSTVVTAHQETGEDDQDFVIPGKAEVTCENANFAGTVEGEEAATVTVHPKYSGCTAVSNATIDTNGCNYILGTETDGNGDAGVQVECETGHSIKITDGTGCTITVGAQTPEGGVSYTNIANGDVTIDITVTGIHYTSNLICQFGGIPSTGEDGIYTGKAIAEGFADEGTLSGNATEGFVYKDETPVNIEVDDTK